MVPLRFVGHETLCYQRVTHTASPRLESRLHVGRQSLSRKVVMANKFGNVHEFC